MGGGRQGLQLERFSRDDLEWRQSSGHPDQEQRGLVACPDWIYINRNMVERLWARLKEWRAIATRYEKTANSFLGVLNLAAALDWIKR